MLKKELKFIPVDEYKVKSAVALIVFNRPDTTMKVFEKVRQVKPSSLFIIADGPRKDNENDAVKCAEVRAIFEKNIDWDCKVFNDFSEVNLGCSKRVSTGITWVFNNVDEAIIIEDDCEPDISFFRYCDEMLEQYRYDTRIMLVSGTNPLLKWQRGEYSYHFSNFGGIWGWASWARAWRYYDIDVSQWSSPIIKKMVKFKLNKIQYLDRSVVYDKLVNNSINATTWDYQWGFARLIQSGLAIVPNRNLITNIGHGIDATHNHNLKSPVANLPLSQLEFPLIHPSYVIADKEYDNFLYQKITAPYWRLYLSLFKRKLLKLLKFSK